MKFRIIALLFLMVLVGSIVSCGCNSAWEQQGIINKEPVVQAYCPEYVFTVFETPKQIDSLQIKRVIVRRESKDGGLLFSAIIISPDKKLVVGQEVDLLEVSYRHNAIGNKQSFLLVK